MALREFVDSEGTVWMVWDVPPARSYDPPRSGTDRRTGESSRHAPERRAVQDRRRRNVPPFLLHGWICFECEREKRRLVPPPPEWDSCSDSELEALCREAPVSTPRAA